MNVSPRLALALQEAGIEAVHWSAIGAPVAQDSTIAGAALELGAIIVTHDLDFGALLARSGASRPSVIQIRADDLSVPQLADVLVPLCRDFEAELAAGALVTLDVPNARIRSLPIPQ